MLCVAQSGYPCLSLHGGKDQSDRESTISDFKSNVCNVLVATSIAARGLDVKDLVRLLSFKGQLDEGKSGSNLPAMRSIQIT